MTTFYAWCKVCGRQFLFFDDDVVIFYGPHDNCTQTIRHFHYMGLFPLCRKCKGESDIPGDDLDIIEHHCTKKNRCSL